MTWDNQRRATALGAILQQRAQSQPGLSSADRATASRGAANMAILGALPSMGRLLRGEQMTPAWPIPGPPMAWGVPGSLPASRVPLRPADLRKNPTMTWHTYIQELADRVAWMMEQEDDPQAAQAELARALEDMGAWTGPRRFESPSQAAAEMMVGNPAFKDLLTASFRLPASPWHLRQMPAAVRAIQETTLGEWIDRALWKASDGLEI